MAEVATRLQLDRRRLLKRAAFVTGGAAMFTSGPLRTLAQVSAAPTLPGQIPAAGPIGCFDVHTYDAMAGISAFVIPGNDPYSHHQGVATVEPGAVAAGAPQALALSLDQVLADPAVLGGLSRAIEARYGPVPPEAAGNVCRPLGSHIPQPGTIALAPLIGLLVDLLALGVRPSSATGQFTSAFARLRWDEKAEVWRRFEQEVPAALMPPTWLLESPILGAFAGVLETLAGVLAYASGAVLELVGLFTYCEGLAYDRSARELIATPLGWELSRYQLDTGVVDGWDELLGYYQGRTSVDA